MDVETSIKDTIFFNYEQPIDLALPMQCQAIDLFLTLKAPACKDPQLLCNF
jgi:hypothetical protein